MISDPPIFVLIGLGLALVAMFAAGFYWLATMDRRARPHRLSLHRRLTALPSRVPSMSTNSTNERRSRRIPITSLTLRMKPVPKRAIAIRRLVGAKNLPHPVWSKPATTGITRSNR